MPRTARTQRHPLTEYVFRNERLVQPRGQKRQFSEGRTLKQFLDDNSQYEPIIESNTGDVLLQVFENTAEGEEDYLVAFETPFSTKVAWCEDVFEMGKVIEKLSAPIELINITAQMTTGGGLRGRRQELAVR